jgi:hypothetical protein
MTVIAMTERSEIEIGTRVYLKFAIAGDPGCVVGFDARGRALVEWYDLDLGHRTAHDPANLVVDQAFRVAQFHLDFEDVAA